MFYCWIKNRSLHDRTFEHYRMKIEMCVQVLMRYLLDIILHLLQRLKWIIQAFFPLSFSRAIVNSLFHVFCSSPWFLQPLLTPPFFLLLVSYNICISFLFSIVLSRLPCNYFRTHKVPPVHWCNVLRCSGRNL